MEINALPIEVFSQHIFKYFSFKEWLQILVLVCKHWQAAAIQSSLSKQLTIDLDQNGVQEVITDIMVRYKLDTLTLTSLECSMLLITKVLNASPKLRTLEIGASSYNEELLIGRDYLSVNSDFKPKKTFNNITTLSILAAHLDLLFCFPNVTKLRLCSFRSNLFKSIRSTSSVFPNVRELEISTKDQKIDSCIAHARQRFPSLEVLYVNLVGRKRVTDIEMEWKAIEDAGLPVGLKVYPRNHHVAENSYDSPMTSYYLYTKEHSMTPLTSACYLYGSDDDISKIEKMIEKTSPIYEKELIQRDNEFYFPLKLSRGPQKHVEPLVLGDIDNIELINLLLHHKFVDYWSAFSQTVHLQQFDETLKMLQIASEHLPIPKTSFESFASLMINKSPEKILEIIGRETFRSIVNEKNPRGENILFSYAKNDSGEIIDFSPIEDLIDWCLINEKKINAATIAFNKSHFNLWKFLLEKGNELQFREYDTDSMTHFLSIVRDTKNSDMLDCFAKTTETKQWLLYKVISCSTEESLEFDNDIVTKFGKEIIEEFDLDGKSFLTSILENEDFDNWEITLPYLVKTMNLDINKIDKSGNAPLAFMLRNTDLSSVGQNAVKIILRLGANPNLAGDRLMPLFLAISQESYQLEMIDLLLDHGADINLVDFDEYGRKATVLSYAVSIGSSPKIISFLISRGAKTDFLDNAGNTLLHSVLLAEELESIIALVPLLSKYVNINQPNKLNETPLHRILLSGYDVSLVDTYIKNGADVNLPGGPYNQPPLILALTYYPTLKPILKHEKIDLKAKNNIGESFFYAMCRMVVTAGDFEDLSTLLADQEFVQICQKIGTPEMIEYMTSEIRRFLHDEPKLLNTINALCTTELPLLKFLVETVGFDVNTQDCNGDTLLLRLSVNSKNSLAIAEYLIEKGAKIDIQNNLGNTALYQSARYSSMTREQFKFRRLLLKNGASISIKNNQGFSPLDLDPNIEKRYLTDEPTTDFFDDRTINAIPKVKLSELRKQNTSV